MAKMGEKEIDGAVDKIIFFVNGRKVCPRIAYRKQGKFRWAKLSQFLEERESFSHKSFVVGTTYKHPGLAPRKYYQENPYNVNTVKV